MIIIQTPSSLLNYIHQQKALRFSIGFVPTMGALHEGHINLVKHSGKQCDLTVCSIFINPTQFNDPADFKKYPSTLPADIKLLANSSADVLFLPSPSAIYPWGTENLEHYDLGFLDTTLEGRHRPGHFQGVCQVMDRLLQVTDPDKLFMGQKDYQQCMVVKRLLQLRDSPAELVTCPTERESDGLAMSSRNLRLGAAQRQKAALIYSTLQWVRENLIPGPVLPVQQQAVRILSENGFKPDYVEVADATTLQPVDAWDGNTRLVILAAAFLGEVRLIDNLVVPSE